MFRKPRDVRASRVFFSARKSFGGFSSAPTAGEIIKTGGFDQKKVCSKKALLAFAVVWWDEVCWTKVGKHGVPLRHFIIICFQSVGLFRYSFVMWCSIFLTSHSFHRPFTVRPPMYTNQCNQVPPEKWKRRSHCGLLLMLLALFWHDQMSKRALLWLFWTILEKPLVLRSFSDSPLFSGHKIIQNRGQHPSSLKDDREQDQVKILPYSTGKLAQVHGKKGVGFYPIFLNSIDPLFCLNEQAQVVWTTCLNVLSPSPCRSCLVMFYKLTSL